MNTQCEYNCIIDTDLLAGLLAGLLATGERLLEPVLI